MAFPKFFRVRQKFAGPTVRDVPAAVRAQLQRLALEGKVRKGQSVAVTAGSRGIANIAVIIRAVVDFFKGLGAEPFIVPAMGSHGGATAEGQKKIVESYGITEESCGCRIRSSMDTVVACMTGNGIPIHFDRLAHEADHVFLVNRVKPHTLFTGEVESGLTKMMLVGLGKREGAGTIHAAAREHGWDKVVPAAAEVARKCGVIGGLAVVENGREETARVEAVAPGDFERRDHALLEMAREWMAGLPFREVDVLLVDEIGKNISGTGMDTNVIGRGRGSVLFPKIGKIAVRGLTASSGGNALGIGFADFCSKRLAEQADMEATRINAETSGRTESAQLPPVCETDREMLEKAGAAGESKVLWIRNTLALEEAECSEAYLERAREREDLEVLTEPRDLSFDAAGNLASFDSGAPS